MLPLISNCYVTAFASVIIVDVVVIVSIVAAKRLTSRSNNLECRGNSANQRNAPVHNCTQKEWIGVDGQCLNAELRNALLGYRSGSEGHPFKRCLQATCETYASVNLAAAVLLQVAA